MKQITFIIMVVILTGCAITREQTYNSPYLPEACSNKFPPTVKTIVTTTVLPGNDSARLRSIDSAVEKGTDLVNKLRRDSAYAADSISQKCADIVGSYINQIRSLQQKIRQTKPCVPDTIRHDSIIDRTDVALITSLQNKNGDLTSENMYLEAETSRKNRIIWVGIPVALVAGFVLSRLFKTKT